MRFRLLDLGSWGGGFGAWSMTPSINSIHKGGEVSVITEFVFHGRRRFGSVVESREWRVETSERTNQRRVAEVNINSVLPHFQPSSAVSLTMYCKRPQSHGYDPLIDLPHSQNLSIQPARLPFAHHALPSLPHQLGQAFQQ